MANRVGCGASRLVPRPLQKGCSPGQHAKPFKQNFPKNTLCKAQDVTSMVKTRDTICLYIYTYYLPIVLFNPLLINYIYVYFCLFVGGFFKKKPSLNNAFLMSLVLGFSCWSFLCRRCPFVLASKGIFNQSFFTSPKWFQLGRLQPPWEKPVH